MLSIPIYTHTPQHGHLLLLGDSETPKLRWQLWGAALLSSEPAPRFQMLMMGIPLQALKGF